MLNDSLRQRLEALNREQLPTTRFAVQARASRPTPRAVAPATQATESEAVLVENESGSHLLYRRPLADLWPAGPRLVAGRLQHLKGESPAGDLGSLITALPHRALLLDLETCGLAGAALFLVGVLRWIDEEPTIELLFARNWSEEAAVLASLWARLREVDVLATYNGKSFDWPMVMDRSRRHLLHKRQTLREPAHVDLLHHARRKWRAVLPDCKLQTIEQRVCRRPRGADIPGSQIPAAYDAYVRTGCEQQMRLVRQHNAQDLVTLLDISMRVAG